MNDLLLNETYPVAFSCEAIGEPFPIISWYINAQKINDTNKYNISEFANETVVTSMLTIQNESYNYIVGTYICEARNSIGINRESAVLTSYGK